MIKSCIADQLVTINQVSREGEGKYSTELWSEEAVNTIQDLANSSQPWFLQVQFGDSCFFVISLPGGLLCAQGALPGKKTNVPDNHCLYFLGTRQVDVIL